VCSQYFYKAEEGRLAVTNTSSDGDAGGFDREDGRHRNK
jgi:hypothetical protein